MVSGTGPVMSARTPPGRRISDRVVLLRRAEKRPWVMEEEQNNAVRLKFPTESFWEGQHGILWAARTSVAEYGTFVTCCSAQLLPSGVSTPWNHNWGTLPVHIIHTGEKHGGLKVSQFQVGEDKY